MALLLGSSLAAPRIACHVLLPSPHLTRPHLRPPGTIDIDEESDDLRLKVKIGGLKNKQAKTVHDLKQLSGGCCWAWGCWLCRCLLCPPH